MKKIGITTFHRAHNYGAVLQAYALKKALEKENNQVEFIDYISDDMEKMYKVIKISKKNMYTRVKSFIAAIAYFGKNKSRYNNFNKFIDKNFKMTHKYSSIEELKKDPPTEDIYITGSDQVWNPEITGGLSDIYTLNFGSDRINRVSYAASIGNNSLGKEDYQGKLSKLNYISVREETAKNLLQPIINKPIKVVVDPTLLIDSKEWEEEFDLKDNEKEPYILTYHVAEYPEYVKIINELSRKTGLKVITFEKRKKKNYNNILRCAYADGPEEFVRLIKNAKYVVTTSFHATVFSVIFHKKLFVVPHNSTGSRMIDLLNKLGLQDRIYYSLEEFKNCDYDREINYKKVEEKLSKEREESLIFLKNALKYNKDDENE